MEEWKNINKEYEISNLGRIRRTKNNGTKYLKPEVLKKGYLRVSIWENGTRKRILVHRLVAQMFIPNKDKTKTQIDHINNNTSDNRVENLRWVTPKENVQHSIEQGRFVTEIKIKAFKNVKMTQEEFSNKKKQKWDNELLSNYNKTNHLDKIESIINLPIDNLYKEYCTGDKTTMTIEKYENLRNDFKIILKLIESNSI